jgi:hypothetical protein
LSAARFKAPACRLSTYTLYDLLCRYETEITPQKRGAASELYGLKALKASEIAGSVSPNAR